MSGISNKIPGKFVNFNILLNIFEWKNIYIPVSFFRKFEEK